MVKCEEFERKRSCLARSAVRGLAYREKSRNIREEYQECVVWNRSGRILTGSLGLTRVCSVAVFTQKRVFKLALCCSVLNVMVTLVGISTRVLAVPLFKDNNCLGFGYFEWFVSKPCHEL
jgi:hypothetical protein